MKDTIETDLQFKKGVSPATRLDFIDGCRGFAVCAVVLFHAMIWSRAGVPRLVGDFAAMVGRGGVDIFLVVSGFCLTWPLVSRSSGLVAPLKLRSFIIRRISRIYPPYLVALAVAVVFNAAMQAAHPHWFAGPFGDVFDHPAWGVIGSLVSHLLLLHGFTPYHHDIDGAFWSLSLEWQFYFLFPLLAWIAAKRGVRTAFVVTLIATLAFRVIVKCCGASYVWIAYYNETALARWCEFGSGVWLASQVATPVQKRWAKDALVLIVFAGTVLVGFFRPTFFLAPILWGAVGASVIYVAAANGTLINRAARGRFLTWIGDRSYSLYLIHGSVFMAFSLAIGSLKIVSPTKITVIYFGPGIALAIAAAVLMYRVVEWPMLRRRTNTGISNITPPPLSNDNPVAIGSSALLTDSAS